MKKELFENKVTLADNVTYTISCDNSGYYVNGVYVFGSFDILESVISECGSGPSGATDARVKSWSMTFECKGYNPISDTLGTVILKVDNLPVPDEENDPEGSWIGVITNTQATIIDYDGQLEHISGHTFKVNGHLTMPSSYSIAFINNSNDLVYYVMSGQVSSTMHLYQSSFPLSLRKPIEEEVE